MDRFKFIKEKNFDELPKTSGVYCFTEKAAEARLPLIYIYIGKAIDIKNRVKNHFSQPSYRDNLFINKVDKVGYLETNSEIEALILEANLIKKYQPKYNVVWRDDKNYFYVAFRQTQSKLKIPYLYITHQPFNAAQGEKNDKAEYIGPFVEGAALKKTLRFLRRVFPYYTNARHPKNKCTYCHLDLCPGPELFENPPSQKALEGLREYRRNIKKLILILQGKRNAVLNLLKKEMHQLSKENKFEEAGKIRDRIYALQQVMSHTHVIGGANKAAEVKTEKILQKILDVKNISRIECYDISNIQGKQATGSMIVFINDKPDKNQYRKFKIKIENTPNDIAMLKEVLERRFLHNEWKYPDVILIDGGKAQLNIAIKVKNEKPETKHVKAMAIAKGRQELFIEGRREPIPLKSLPQEVYNLIKNLDDEAHRFAITYHKKLRKENLLK